MRSNIKFNPIALREAKIVYNFGLSECERVKSEIKNYINIPLNTSQHVCPLRGVLRWVDDL